MREDERQLEQASEQERFEQQVRERRDAERRHLPPRFRGARVDRVLGEHGLYLYGPVGRGKTYAASALCNQAIEADKSVRWLSSSRWLQLQREAFGGGQGPPSDGYYLEGDVLVIDDLGSEKPSEWSGERLFTLVNMRYELARGVLIVTSNYRILELAVRIGERTASRLAEMCDVVRFVGPDRRLVQAYERKARRDE